MILDPPSRMFVEAAESGAVAARQRKANAAALVRLCAQLRKQPPRAVLTLGRGSSDNAATFGRYLVERQLGVLTSSVAPSVASVYEATPTLADTLLIAISQSGRSPDLLATVDAARAQGARIVAMVNDETSPLAHEADALLALSAGPERSVAATKSFIASLVAALDLIAAWTSDAEMARQLDALPDLLDRAWALDWSAAIEPLADARNLFVIARGHALGVAQEIALKFKETCGLHAEAISAAEVRHGPMTLVGEGFPVLILGQPDETRESVAALAREFAGRGAMVFHAGLDIAEGVSLPVLPADPLIAPVLQVQSFYRFCEALARCRGIDPDQPPHLDKVTETL
ncbi:SIS domain-containing protein [Sphingobium sp. LMC3-1-1.1]|uniref:SIS domain-containing protein n=1 Tax=Sphingobium sp. LMC3-1-1.1 TaxID=3135241 RepID=UPI003440C01B